MHMKYVINKCDWMFWLNDEAILNENAWINKNGFKLFKWIFWLNILNIIMLVNE